MGTSLQRLVRLLFSIALLAAANSGVFAAQQAGDQSPLAPAGRVGPGEDACGPKLKHETKTEKKQHPVPEPSSERALVFVVRPTMMGNKVQTKLAVDGRWVGINRGNNYFFFELDPGEYTLCSQAENRSVMTLAVEAGKTYFLQQKIRMGFMKATNELVEISDAEGRAALRKTHPSSFIEK